MPSEKIWEYLGQFGGLDIKTSKAQNWGKSEIIGHLKKIQNGTLQWYQSMILAPDVVLYL